MTGEVRGIGPLAFMAKVVEGRPNWAPLSWPLFFMSVSPLGIVSPATKRQDASQETLISSEHNWLSEDDPGRNYSTGIQLRTRPGKGNGSHAIVRFDLTSIPTSAKIISAVFGIYEEAVRNNAQTIALYRLTEPWTKLGSTWTTRDGTTCWAVPGGTYDETPLGSFHPTSVGFKTFDVTCVVQNWVGGTYPNNGFILVPTMTEERGNAGSNGHEMVRFETPYLDLAYILDGASPVTPRASGSWAKFVRLWGVGKGCSA